MDHETHETNPTLPSDWPVVVLPPSSDARQCGVAASSLPTARSAHPRGAACPVIRSERHGTKMDLKMWWTQRIAILMEVCFTL